jgi:Fic family protein
MLDLEKFINHNEKYDLLVVISLVHYQFETIHPFLDGNGRIGRMIALLMMLEKKALTYPILYLSYFLKKNKLDYSEYLTKVRRTGDYES